MQPCVVKVLSLDSRIQAMSKVEIQTLKLYNYVLFNGTHSELIQNSFEIYRGFTAQSFTWAVESIKMFRSSNMSAAWINDERVAQCDHD